MQKKKLDFFSNDVKIQKVLESFNKNNRISSKILRLLSIIGEFDKKIEVFIYEIIDDDMEKTIKLFCTDNNDDIFIINGMTNNNSNIGLVEHIGNLEEESFNVVLSKKFEINEDNVCLLKTQKVFDFKYGRLITDNKSFYTIFIGDDICYQLLTNELNISNELLLKELNNIKEKPSLISVLNTIEKCTINYDNIKSVSFFKSFVLKDRIDFNQSMILKKELK